MKIVCDSCGAKYSIADEKVAGKVFKIRCKKCSAVIVVKGDQEEGDESTRVFDYGAEAIWHVVIDGDQQGPFAPRQIADLLAESKIDWEAYVWREGMDGWQPAKDVEVLVSAVMAEAESTAGAARPAAGGAAYGSGQVFGGSSDMGADPFAASADDGGLSGVMGKSAGGSAGGADLFARSDRSPFSGAAEGDGHTASSANGAGGPRVSEGQSLTGQRNENSVLFSLSNLQALATGSGSAPATARPKPGMAQGEGSGLIDIRALASATQAVGEGRANGSSKDSVEDLLSVGGGNAFSAASLAAPVAGDKSESNNTKLIAGFGAVIVLLVMVVGYLVVRQPAAAPIAEAPVVVAPVAPAAQAAAVPPPVAPAEQPTDQAAGKDEPSGSADNEDKSARGSEVKRRRPGGGGGDSTRAADKTDEPSAPVAAAPAKSSGDKSLDDLLDSALGGKPSKPAAATKPAADPSASLPSMPAKDDVLGAMKGVTPRVQSCGNGQSGVAMAKITVSGATGRVTNVDVSGQFAGTPVASCVTREVSKAKFPKFSQSSFSIAYPFKI